MSHPLRIAFALAAALVLVIDNLPLMRGFAVQAAPSHQAPEKAVEKGVKLLMVERPGCIHCAAFRRDIAPGYATSVQGRQAPLVTIDIDGPWPDGLALGTAPYLTPTFILLHDGVEVSRILGYPGPDRFYPMLSQIMQDAGVARN